MGTRVVNQAGEVVGGGAGIGRKFLHILDTLVCLLGWLLPLVDSKRQTIADKVMSTPMWSQAWRRSPSRSIFGCHPRPDHKQQLGRAIL